MHFGEFKVFIEAGRIIAKMGLNTRLTINLQSRIPDDIMVSACFSKNDKMGKPDSTVQYTWLHGGTWKKLPRNN